MSVSRIFFAMILALMIGPASVFADSFEGKTSMNGIQLKDYKDFEKNWKLVTVRFRKDTEELRWTFANDAAMKVIEAGTNDYPDGAVIGKVGVRTLPDPLFISSSVPMGARRYQLMVRNKEKFKDTGGWGYALFDVNGKTFQENPADVTKACYACHLLARSRADVFSQTFALAPYVKLAPHQNNGEKVELLKFKWVDRKELSANFLKNLPEKFKKIRVIANSEFSKSVFQGTFDEIKPTLEREAFEQKAPAALISDSGDRFSLIFGDEQPGCKTNRSFVSKMTRVDGEVIVTSYCNP